MCASCSSRVCNAVGEVTCVWLSEKVCGYNGAEMNYLIEQKHYLTDNGCLYTTQVSKGQLILNKTSAWYYCPDVMV